jgi:amino acid/peptide:H+ symporter
MLTSSKVAAIERTRVRAFIPLFIANAVFWSLFQQIFTVLAVYSDERMNWSIFGWTAPSSWIGSIEPVWIIVLSPLFAIMWTRLGNRAPTTPRKFAYGVTGMGLAFLLFLPVSGTTGKAVPALLVVGIMAVFAVSELLLSPIGLSVTTKLAPEAFRAQMMALYSSLSALAPRCQACWPATTIRLTNLLTSGSSGPSRLSPAWSSSPSRPGSAGSWRACTRSPGVAKSCPARNRNCSQAR